MNDITPEKITQILCLGVIVLFVALVISIIFYYRNLYLTSEQIKNYKEIKTEQGSVIHIKLRENTPKIYYCSHCFYSRILTLLQPSTQNGTLECREGHGRFPI